MAPIFISTRRCKLPLLGLTLWVDSFVTPFVLVPKPRPRPRPCGLTEQNTGLDTTDGEVNNKESRARSRLKTHFDRLFLGTPSMQDILSGAPEKEIQKSREEAETAPEPAFAQAHDDDQAQAEAEQQKEIQEYYQTILQQMSAELMEQRKLNPGGVPTGADEMLRAVLMQEMQLEIQAAKDSNNDNNQSQNQNKATNADNQAVADWLKRRRPARSQSPSSQQEQANQQLLNQDQENDPSAYDMEEEEQEQHMPMTQPETMKEWQMYRSISSKLGRTRSTEEEVADRYQSWKDYVQMEQLARKQAGLTRELTMPFEWQEVELERAKRKAERDAAIIRQGGVKSTAEVRDDVDQKSIQALQMLIQKTQDPVRNARLQKTLLTLKQELEASRLATPDEPFLSQLDTPDIGAPMTSSGAVTYETYLSPTETYDDEEITDQADNMATKQSTLNEDKATDSFSKALAAMKVSTTPPANDESSTEKQSSGGYSLGTIEEQKLRSLFQRAGARTTEDQAAVRAQWEDFNRYEQSMRDEFGMSETVDAEVNEKAPIDYAAITNEFGEIDTEKLLASIGPRPTRKRKPKGPGSGSQSPPDDESAGSEEQN